MRIAICDKNIEFSNHLKRKLYSYSNLNRYEFLAETFQSGEELLNSQNKYAIIFIEYTLDGINGLETARELRRRNNKSIIIFLTACTHFIFEAFSIEACRFLTKPLDDAMLSNTLDQILPGNYPLLINIGGEITYITTNEIIYLEANNKYCYIHLLNKTLQSKKTMAQVLEALPKSHFQKIHRSFVVNLNQISKYNSENVFLKNGTTLHVTRTYFKNFKQNYIDFSCPIIL